jgi:hypothetical protein
MKKFIVNILTVLCLTVGIGVSNNAVSQNAPQKTQPTTTSQAAVYAQPLEILNNAQKYLNKPVKIQAKFNRFTTLGLDYPKALRSSENYISFIVQRNDVVDHDVPLSEMKLFMERKLAESFIELDTNDKIKIDGVMFSNALGDVWIDVNKIQIVEKAKKTENK